MSIEQLKPAEQGAVAVYMPYYQGAKRNMLPLAISLYQQGELEGQRKIEGGESIPFVATWYVSKLPSELTRVYQLSDRHHHELQAIALDGFSAIVLPQVVTN
jgi:hypothetical protein